MRSSIVMVLLAAGAANAGVVTVDAGTFATGANLTSATPGITLREFTNFGVSSGAVYNPVYAVANTTGLNAGINLIGRSTSFNFSNSADAEDCFEGINCHHAATDHDFHALVMRFAVPTNLIEVRVHFTDSWLDGMKLNLYNAQRQLLASCWANGTNPSPPRTYPTWMPSSVPCGYVAAEYDCNSSGTSCNYEKVMRLTRAIPDVAYAIWAGETWDSGIGAVNKITFRRFSDCAP